MGKIKTRRERRDIKVLDKPVIVAERIKKSHVQSKEDMTQTKEHATPEEYAEDRIMSDVSTSAHKGAYHASVQGGKLAEVVKERYRYTKEIRQRTEEIQRERAGASSRERQSVSASGSKIDSPSGERMKRKMQNQITKRQEGSKVSVLPQKTVNQSRNSIKTNQFKEQNSIKNAGKSIKTGRRTTIKSTEKAVKQAQQTEKVAKQTARKAAQGAKQSANVAKKMVKATTKAVKAIIEATKAITTALISFGWIAVLILIIVILFGGLLYTTGGDNSNTVTPVSMEVQKYEPVIRKYAKQYGIAEYVELIKAIMMQESGGQGTDPMQSSEGNFNIKYPKKPNGITDPEYSIECGVQEIKSCLIGAEVKSPMDMDNIKLALQGYNYGNGYIQWAKNHYGGYTLANAAEFSNKMAKEKGWESYGDKQYVPHVLRYYTIGRVPNGMGNQAIVQVALAQEGNGGNDYWSWYGFPSRVSWCACFVSWCAEQSGYLTSGVLPKFSLCSDGVKWFQDKGQFKDGSYVPAPGNIIFFDWGKDGTIDHVGIVESVSKGNVNTIEGNSGDRVKRHSYPIGDERIYGYGVY